MLHGLFVSIRRRRINAHQARISNYSARSCHERLLPQATQACLFAAEADLPTQRISKDARLAFSMNNTRTLRVHDSDGAMVAGAIELGKAETAWRFVPKLPGLRPRIRSRSMHISNIWPAIARAFCLISRSTRSSQTGPESFRFIRPRRSRDALRHIPTCRMNAHCMRFSCGCDDFMPHSYCA